MESPDMRCGGKPCGFDPPCGSPGAEFDYICESDPLIEVDNKAAVSDFAGQIDGTGYKTSMDDPNKIPLWFVPVSLLKTAGRALAHGAKKYAANNWRKGMNYSEVYSALQRHLGAWLEGEDLDPESGLNHLDHAAACLGFLTEYVEHPGLYGKFDNRFKRPSPPEALEEDHRASRA